MEFSGIALVTGGAGFMGSHLVEYLFEKGARVRASSRRNRSPEFFRKLGVEFIEADLTRPETLPALFEGEVDRVFHLGAICNFSTPYQKLYPTNVQGVSQITRLALEAKVKRFIHVSSTSVYGYYTGKPFAEDDQRLPRDSYGRSKRDGENVVFERMKEGLPATILRPCAVYGARCNDGAGKAFSRPSSIAAIPGNGRQRLSNIRAEDVAAAAEFLSHCDDTIGQAYNIAEKTYPTIEEALTLAAEVFGTRKPTLHLPIPLLLAVAYLSGKVSGWRGKIPDLEYDALKYLDRDYIVETGKLDATGFTLMYPDFAASIRQLGESFRA
ncbi:MAG: NAD-dependent epimerase/dehydratase family protein [Bradymonadales bacterium]|nr:NAD-dependent epimerase/dehydratase family protein [Bradymonadales bacterium]